MELEIIKAEISKLSLDDGDILVFRTLSYLNSDEFTNLKCFIKELNLCDNKIIIIDKEIEVSKITQDHLNANKLKILNKGEN